MSRNPLRTAAVWAYDLRRASQGASALAFRTYQDALRQRVNARGLSAEARTAATLTSLRRAVREAARLPFWADRLSDAGLDWQAEFSFADFQRVPILERADIAAAGDDLLRPETPPVLRRKMATGGSSGTPTVTWTGPLERGWIESGIEFAENEVGVDRTSRRALLWGHNLDPVTRATPRERAEDWLWHRRWYDCFRLSATILREYFADMARFQPTVVVAYATALASLAEAVRDQGLGRPTFPAAGFITGAEKLFADQRATIEQVFGKPVFERYGGRDLGFIGMQRRGDASHAFHLDWLNIYVEPEHDHEEDSIVVTKLHADAMPMLRYRTGDIGRFGGDASIRPVFELQEVLGRELQRIVRPDGGWMHGTVVPHLLKDFPFRVYQLRQAVDLSVTLSYVPLAPMSAAEEAAVRKALHDNLPNVPITLTAVSDIPRTSAGKWLPVVSDASPATMPAVPSRQ